MVACRETFDEDASARLFFDDITSSTLYAPADFVANDRLFGCDDKPLERGGLVDLLFVIDNSVSMLDEQQATTRAAQAFLERLSASNLDWRLGVTTTDAYCAGSTECAGASQPDTLKQDPANLCSQLRGVGFIGPNDADLASLFSTYVTQNPGCVPPAPFGNDPETHGQNVCGDGFERGLESALFVLDKLTGETPCSENGRHALRRDPVTGMPASLAIVYLSDEENYDLQDAANAFEPLPSDDSARMRATQDYIDAFNSLAVTVDQDTVTLDITSLAIVGDEGTNGVGVCTPLDLASASVAGAQHGMGYIDVVNATRGSVTSICAEDLEAPIDSFIRTVIGDNDNVGFDEAIVISSSILVNINGTDVGRQGATTWSYNRTNQTITLSGLGNIDPDPEGNFRIAIGYWRWTPAPEG